MIAYHPRAKTTIEIRKEIKENQEGLTVREQAKKYNVSTKTIMKWRKRDNPYDEKHGTKDLYKNHIKITPLEEYIICEIRKTALLGLDDLLEVVNSIGIKINRSALEMHDVDILSTPELNRKDSGLDHVLARLAGMHRVAIELNFNRALMAKNYDRARILMAFRRNLKLAEKFDAPVVISSDANDIYSIKSPHDLRAFLNTLVDAEYSKKIIETAYKIAEYRAYLKKKNVVRYGVEIVEENGE